MAADLQSPEKELRFTRAAQSIPYWIGSAVFAGIAITLFATSFYREVNPLLPHPAWALIPLLLAVGSVRTASKMTRHAYLILTPLGIEIFPYFSAARKMRLVLWQEIDHAAIDPASGMISLHFDSVETSGIHLSLRPIRKELRSLLAKAVDGRLSPRGEIQP